MTYSVVTINDLKILLYNLLFDCIIYFEDFNFICRKFYKLILEFIF